MSFSCIEVPMQPYAGSLLIIDQLIVPENIEKSFTEEEGKASVIDDADMSRPSYFEARIIERTLIKYCIMESMKKNIKDELVNGLLAAVETYIKYLITQSIELSEHRSGNSLYIDPRCVIHHDMRTTMIFLNDREVADHGCSDDESNYGHRRRWMKLHRNRSTHTLNNEMRMESTNNTAHLALGARRAAAGAGPGYGFGPGNNANQYTMPGFDKFGEIGILPGDGIETGSEATPQRSFLIRIKHVNVKDIIQFMAENKRYLNSKLLYDAYLLYKW